MKNILLLFVGIVFFSSCCKEKVCPSGEIIDLSGIYYSSFTGSYSFNSNIYNWERNQLMKVSKVNDSIHSLCVFYGNTCVEGTNSFLKLSKSNFIEGTFFYQKAHAIDWHQDKLFGYYHIEDKSFSGIFFAETVVDLPPPENGFLLLPVYGTFLFTKTN